jgi:hypothetical protein
VEAPGSNTVPEVSYVKFLVAFLRPYRNITNINGEHDNYLSKPFM